jgi:hypothetical protein
MKILTNQLIIRKSRKLKSPKVLMKMLLLMRRMKILHPNLPLLMWLVEYSWIKMEDGSMKVTIIVLHQIDIQI